MIHSRIVTSRRVRKSPSDISESIVERGANVDASTILSIVRGYSPQQSRGGCNACQTRTCTIRSLVRPSYMAENPATRHSSRLFTLGNSREDTQRRGQTDGGRKGWTVPYRETFGRVLIPDTQQRNKDQSSPVSSLSVSTTFAAGQQTIVISAGSPYLDQCNRGSRSSILQTR